MPRVFIQSFGCRASQADGAALEASLAGAGFTPGSLAEAELVVLNTCTVTAAADRDIRQTVHRLYRQAPGRPIAVTGCYAQRAPEELAALPGVVLVAGNSRKDDIAAWLAGSVPYHGSIQVASMDESRSVPLAAVEYGAGDHARPNLKIQDGCNLRCSFCIIPSVRGSSRSVDAGQIVREVSRLSASYAEVVLTGINLGRWGRDQARELRLEHLLRRLLAETGVQSLRLSSVEPMDWTEELIELVSSSPRIARHMHMPLQSGSDSVLRRMHRRYRPRHYAERMRQASQLMPLGAFGADVMTGFPGETAQEFEDSLDFIRELPFTYLHVFPYSERPGTAACHLPGSVPPALRSERAQTLIAFARERNLEFRSQLCGQTWSAAVLNDGTHALTSNYVSVKLALPRTPRTLTSVQLGGLTSGGMFEDALTSGSSAPPLFPLHPTSFATGCSH